MQLFEGAWSEIVDSYSDDFVWILGETMLSSPVTIVTTMVSYAVLAYLLRYLDTLPCSFARFLNRCPMRITPIKFLHNAFLCLFSVLMFVNIVKEVWTAVEKVQISDDVSYFARIMPLLLI